MRFHIRFGYRRVKPNIKCFFYKAVKLDYTTVCFLDFPSDHLFKCSHQKPIMGENILDSSLDLVVPRYIKKHVCVSTSKLQIVITLHALHDN